MPRDLSTFDPSNVTDNEIYKFLTAHWQHQNQLSWSKLYALLALESGTLAASYTLKGGLGAALIVVGTLVGLILYRLILRDWDVRNQGALLALLDSVHRPLGVSMVPPAGSRWSNGRFLLNCLFALLFITNMVGLCVIWLLPKTVLVG